VIESYLPRFLSVSLSTWLKRVVAGRKFRNFGLAVLAEASHGSLALIVTYGICF
jgi:hypothetical protein